MQVFSHNSSCGSACFCFYNSSLILRSFVASSVSVSSCGIKVTSLVSDWAVSRLERLCVAMADGSGDVSVILEPYAALSFVEKVLRVFLAV